MSDSSLYNQLRDELISLRKCRAASHTPGWEGSLVMASAAAAASHDPLALAWRQRSGAAWWTRALAPLPSGVSSARGTRSLESAELAPTLWLKTSTHVSIKTYNILAGNKILQDSIRNQNILISPNFGFFETDPDSDGRGRARAFLTAGSRQMTWSFAEKISSMTMPHFSFESFALWWSSWSVISWIERWRSQSEMSTWGFELIVWRNRDHAP